MRRCSATDCTDKHAALGYCIRHYQQFRLKGEVGPIRKMTPRGSCADRDEQGRKLCTACDEWLDPSRYGIHRGTIDRLQPRCMRCGTLARHRMTKASFADLFAAQGGACAICEGAEPGGRGYWHIDHDHACCPGERSCGECVRGILCHACNTGIGSLKDSPDVLRRAADYLEAALTKPAT